ncbi:DUF998 domain-containing protein [Jidongwangia harbinensis]|uniref:DUF998 domain-containing protein n=1 Tax=Jidongwangia harbinensis TaxID=2878561 RepID=UPI001CD92F4A|nr:DUF998 domain-containing protein [Jidongwangia harbinensis]MCA2217410.1 DUF998 domain-containing protein [Jidongwangia harbinensis]
MLTTDTFDRPADLGRPDDPAVLYAKSYLLVRSILGIIGVALPIAFIVGEAWFIDGGVQVRGSLSSYYHSTMRDLFVAALSVTGFLLLTYMAGQRNTYDYWLSTVAGIAVLGVAFFPTTRPGIGDAPACGTSPEPAGCAAIQQHLGEALTARIHFVSAAVFILSLAAIAFVFARREKRHHTDPRLATVQMVCGWVIVAAVGWSVLGLWVDLQIGPLTPLYVTEVVAVWAFGLSWLLTSRALLARLTPRARAPLPATPRAAVTPGG